MLSKYGATAVAARPSQRELDRLHNAVRDLYYKLFKQRFGREADLWDSSDGSALDRYLRSAIGWTVEEGYKESDLTLSLTRLVRSAPISGCKVLISMGKAR